MKEEKQEKRSQETKWMVGWIKWRVRHCHARLLVRAQLQVLSPLAPFPPSFSEYVSDYPTGVVVVERIVAEPIRLQ